MEAASNPSEAAVSGMKLLKLLTRLEPYRWQRRLFAQVSRGAVPDRLEIPTGLGKTKVIALWLAARALGAELPRRLVYVVDRRAVVDQASAEALALADAVEALAGVEGEGWRAALGLAQGERLPVETLRGGRAKAQNKRVTPRWVERPEAAAIVVGTVDMIGSRLLFEGYGVSTGMRPVHAGLLGRDTLFVLDEAHLVPPFEALVRAACEMAAQDAVPVPASRVLALSATGRGDGEGAFRLDDTDYAERAVAERLDAAKHLRVEPPVDKAKLAEALAAHARTLRGRVLVFADSRDVAVQVHKTLGTPPKAPRKAPAAAQASPAIARALLVGARRVHERETLYLGEGGGEDARVFAAFRPGGPHDDAVLVATSAGEVGIDLDADHLVCDLVAWERMVQRLGRVNRRPTPDAVAHVIVVPLVPDPKKPEAAPTMADRAAPFSHAAFSRHPDRTLDASPAALVRARDALPELVARATTPAPLHPALTRPHVEAWAMTSLDTHPGRATIEPWLRGWVDDEPQTRVIWRAHLPIAPDAALDETRAKRELEAFLEAAPPHPREQLETETRRVVDWALAVAARAKSPERVQPPDGDAAPEIDAGDAEEGAAEAAVRDRPKPKLPRDPPVIAVLDRRLRVEHVLTVNALIEADGRKVNKDRLTREWAGRTLVVDRRLAGLEHGLLASGATALPDTIDDGAERDTFSAEEWGRRVVFAPSGDRAWKTVHEWRAKPDSDGDRTGLWIEVRRGSGETRGPGYVAACAQSLGVHHDWTAHYAQRIADALGLEPKHRAMLIAAAAAHDLGKDRAAWQGWAGAPDNGRPYAKTTGSAADRRALGGYRHEFGSLADARLGALAEPERELALHLIAAHHGRARPLIAAVDPLFPPSLLQERAREVALRFARLQRTWGPWGLAWWESLLRAADWAASAELGSGVETTGG